MLQSPTEACSLVQRLREFSEIVQRKLQNNDVLEKDPTEKTGSLLKKKNELESKLEELRKHAIKELLFKAENPPVLSQRYARLQ
jgi:predicted nuclease with TOPRIM domain